MKTVPSINLYVTGAVFCSRYLLNVRNFYIILGTIYLLIIVYIKQLSSASIHDVILLRQNATSNENIRCSFSPNALQPGPNTKRECKMVFGKREESSIYMNERKNNIKSVIRSNILNNIKHREAFSPKTQKDLNISTEVQKNINQLKNNIHKYISTTENNKLDNVQHNAPVQTKWISIASQISKKLKQPNHLHKSSIFSKKRLKILKETIKELHDLKHIPLYESLKNFQLFESYKNKTFTRNISIICQEYNIEGSLDRTVRPNMWESINPPQNYTDVTLVTQISTELLWVLERLLGNWEGPMSVAMYLRREDLKNIVSRMWPYPRIMSRDNLDIHMVLQNGVRFIYLYLSCSFCSSLVVVVLFLFFFCYSFLIQMMRTVHLYQLFLLLLFCTYSGHFYNYKQEIYRKYKSNINWILWYSSLRISSHISIKTFSIFHQCMVYLHS